MSTKTLRKRVALIAVSAMGFGLISGVSPANAAVVHGELEYSATNSTGVLSPSTTINGKLLEGTATLLSTGTIELTAAGGATGTTNTKVVVSAGAYISSATAIVATSASTASAETLSADQLTATSDAGDSLTVTVKVSPSTAAGSTFTVSAYASAATGADVVSRVTVTVASASAQGTVAPSKSYVVWSAYADPAATGTSDSATANETTTGLKLTGHIQLADIYGNAITSTSGALVVTASTGAVVGISSAAGNDPAVGTYSTAVSSLSPEDLNFEVGEATAGAGWSGTVTVTYNGVVIATKTGKISGTVAKLTIEAVKVAKNDGTASTGAFRYEAKDAAGNVLPLAAANVDYSSSSDEKILAAAEGGTASTSDTRGYGSVTAVSAATGSVDLVVQTTLSNGTVIKSNAAKVYVGGKADTYTAKLDKAKYAQGDIATLTVTFKDAKGALANSYDSVVAESATDSSISFPMAKQIGSIARTDLPGAAGTVTYKFNVGDVSSFAAGKYNVVATFGTPANGAAQTVAFEVTGAGGVSNSDILASIVKLITAINKQIAALQKLLLRR